MRTEAKQRSTWPERISKDHQVHQDDSGVDVYRFSELAESWVPSDDDIDDVPVRIRAPSPRDETPLQALLQKLREPSLSDPKAEELLDDVFALEDASDLEMEHAFLDVLQDTGATPNALINILSACVDYEFVLRTKSSLRVTSALLTHGNSFVAVAAAQALLHSVEDAASVGHVEEVVRGASPHSSLLEKVLTKFKRESEEG